MLLILRIIYIKVLSSNISWLRLCMYLNVKEDYFLNLIT